MSFISEQYYKKLCDQLLLQINNTSNLKTVDKEVLRRDFASRAYYTAFLHCLNTISSVDANGSHNKIINALNKEYRLTLVHLKKIRTDTDYEMSSFPEPLKYKGIATPLNRIQAIIEDILNQNKSSLSV